MTKKRQILVLSANIIALAVFLIPVFAFAQKLPSEIVSCGGDGQSPCNICGFVNSIQNLINYMIYGLALPIGAITLAYAGIKYAFAGGDVGAIKSAHSMFNKSIIGLLIALSAWLMVDFVLKQLVIGNVGYTAPWSEIDCSN